MDIKIDLKDYFTNQMFINDKDFDAAYLDSSHPDYLGVDMCCFRYSKTAFGMHSKIDYSLEHIKEKRNIYEKDVIRCDNQVITVPNDKYKKIKFLGGCVWDYFCECISVNYEDGSSDKNKLFFFNFAEPTAESYVDYSVNSTYHKNCRHVLTAFNKDMIGLSVYESEININSSKKIISITLPENDNMCIFAITMIK